METIIGSSGDDFLPGSELDSHIEGREGNDGLDGGEGHDTLLGGDGNDGLFGGVGNDVLDGGDGDDNLNGGFGDDLLIGGDGNDDLGWVFGNDTLFAGDGDDLLRVAATNDPPLGNGSLSGGEGIDSLFVFAQTAVVNLEAGSVQITGFRGETSTGTLESVENVFISFAFDGVLIIGDEGDNVIRSSGRGNDTIIGGLGNDELAGERGQNVYVFDVAPGEADADLVHFHDGSFQNIGPDKLALDSSVMPELGALGDFSENDGRFYAAAGASAGAETDDRVIYDTDTGRLYYDADGSGPVEALLFATLELVPPVSFSASDITVI